MDAQLREAAVEPVQELIWIAPGEILRQIVEFVVLHGEGFYIVTPARA